MAHSHPPTGIAIISARGLTQSFRTADREQTVLNGRAPVGSSANTSSGSLIRARTMLARWASPPENGEREHTLAVFLNEMGW